MLVEFLKEVNKLKWYYAILSKEKKYKLKPKVVIEVKGIIHEYA